MIYFNPLLISTENRPLLSWLKNLALLPTVYCSDQTLKNSFPGTHLWLVTLMVRLVPFRNTIELFWINPLAHSSLLPRILAGQRDSLSHHIYSPFALRSQPKYPFRQASLGNLIKIRILFPTECHCSQTQKAFFLQNTYCIIFSCITQGPLWEPETIPVCFKMENWIYSIN